MSALGALLFVLGAFTPAAAQTGTNNCTTRIDVPTYRHTAHRIYHQPGRVWPRQQYHLLHLRVCAVTGKARHAMNRITVRQRAARQRRRARAKARAQIASLTPYPGPNGTRWAIPWYIVACESGGNWYAHNPSGASGPYQLMPMWGAPYPARTPAQKLANHRAAARLWRGGAGASNWVCA